MKCTNTGLFVLFYVMLSMFSSIILKLELGPIGLRALLLGNAKMDPYDVK